MKAYSKPQDVLLRYKGEAKDPGSFGGYVLKNLHLVLDHPLLSKNDKNKSMLFRIDITDRLTDPFSQMISNGALFTIGDLCSHMSLTMNKKFSKSGVSSSIGLKNFSIDKPRVGEPMYILSNTEKIKGDFGNSNCYFFDHKHKAFAKLYQTVFYYDILVDGKAVEVAG